MKKRANPDSEANIRRIDSKPKAKKQTHGFQVHFLRGTQAVTKMFSDAIHGGKENARRAARKFRRSAMGDLPERIFRGPVSAVLPTKRNKGRAQHERRRAAARRRRPARNGRARKKTAKRAKARR